MLIYFYKGDITIKIKVLFVSKSFNEILFSDFGRLLKCTLLVTFIKLQPSRTCSIIWLYADFFHSLNIRKFQSLDNLLIDTLNNMLREFNLQYYRALVLRNIFLLNHINIRTSSENILEGSEKTVIPVSPLREAPQMRKQGPIISDDSKAMSTSNYLKLFMKEWILENISKHKFIVIGPKMTRVEVISRLIKERKPNNIDQRRNTSNNIIRENKKCQSNDKFKLRNSEHQRNNSNISYDRKEELKDHNKKLLTGEISCKFIKQSDYNFQKDDQNVFCATKSADTKGEPRTPKDSFKEVLGDEDAPSKKIKRVSQHSFKQIPLDQISTPQIQNLSRKARNRSTLTVDMIKEECLNTKNSKIKEHRSSNISKDPVNSNDPSVAKDSKKISETTAVKIIHDEELPREKHKSKIPLLKKYKQGVPKFNK